MGNREIPYNLIPVNTKNISNQHAVNTLQYKALFDNENSANTLPEIDKMLNWKAQLEKLQASLIEEGFNLYEKHLNEIIKEKRLSTSSDIKNCKECFDIFTDMKRFIEDPLRAFDCLYLAQIGSFIAPNDNWVRIAADKWMKKNGFCFPKNHDPKKRKKKDLF